ncbi:integral membrane protein of the MarC family [Dehalogenimonas sp. WBC-2]|nr:integral membrane protein of the MarC family [Dehalogenimonas sp. WBC-2]
MTDFWQSFLLTFVPLFIVVDAIGNLPFVIALTEDSVNTERRRIIKVAVFTASIVGLIFLLFGRVILDAMNISVGAFGIAGGIVLLVLAIRYMTSGHMVEAVKEEMVAVVPIGTPLVVGPATITTLLLLSTQFPFYIVLISFLLNIAITWIIFLSSDWFIRYMGRGGLRAVSRVFSLLLAALAVNMMINGLESLGLINPLTG